MDSSPVGTRSWISCCLISSTDGHRKATGISISLSRGHGREAGKSSGGAEVRVPGWLAWDLDLDAEMLE